MRNKRYQKQLLSLKEKIAAKEEEIVTLTEMEQQLLLNQRLWEEKVRNNGAANRQIWAVG